ncbi:MAG: response regulator [Bacteroidota bacterium]
MDTNFSQHSTNFSGGSTTQDAAIIEQMANYEPHNKILLIEDNPGDARLVEILLSESDLLNCKITNKTNLADGMAALEEADDYAAILLDLTLPDSRGFETLETLLSKFPDNNVIVLTGLQDKSLGINSVKAGAQDFLIKGAFDSDQLAKSLRYSIERNIVLKRLEETQRIANIGNWEYNPSTEEFLPSDQIYRIFGLEPRKTVMNFANILNENHPFKIVNQIHQEALASPDDSIRKDIKVVKQNGEECYVFVQCKASVSAESKVVLTGIMQDITERKKSEDELLRSQEKYQDIFNQSKDPIYICTMDGKCEVFNDALVDLLGYERAEIGQLNLHQLFSCEEGMARVFDKLKRLGDIQDFEFEIERKDGEKRFCTLTATMLESESTPSYNGVIRDITEKKQAEALRKARDLARTSAKMKEKFIASISHEMRTPMNAILGMSNLVIQTELNPEQYNYISSIKQSSELLLGIVNDILEISTLENGKIKFEHKDFDLHELLDNMVKVMKYKVVEKSLDLVIDIQEGVPRYLKGDKLRLNQILYNLVGNAVKFTDKGSIHIRVMNQYDGDDSAFLKFEVEDTGIGIPPDKVDAVFETFTRVRTKDRIFEGTGLGLSIAKNLVEQQAGKIGARSVYGQGSTFWFDIVFDIGTIEEATAPKPELDDTIHLDRPIRLLLVEDNKLNQMVAKKTLQKKWPDIDLTIADNGQLGVEAIKTKKYDIVLMDIQMPIMDGYEATLYIRSNMPPEIANMPILAMTAHANISKDHSYREYGMDDFVLKPFKPEQLFGKIAQYVNHGNGRS